MINEELERLLERCDAVDLDKRDEQNRKRRKETIKGLFLFQAVRIIRHVWFNFAKVQGHFGNNIGPFFKLPSC